MKLVPGHFYKDRAGYIWCCWNSTPKLEPHQRFQCIRLPEGRFEYFFEDGSYDEKGLREHTLIEEVPAPNTTEELKVSKFELSQLRAIDQVARKLYDNIFQATDYEFPNSIRKSMHDLARALFTGEGPLEPDAKVARLTVSSSEGPVRIYSLERPGLTHKLRVFPTYVSVEISRNSVTDSIILPLSLFQEAAKDLTGDAEEPVTIQMKPGLKIIIQT
jgi:hypothetical protein